VQVAVYDPLLWDLCFKCCGPFIRCIIENIIPPLWLV